MGDLFNQFQLVSESRMYEPSTVWWAIVRIPTGQIIATYPKWWFSKGNPLISGKPRLVKYYDLARNPYVHLDSKIRHPAGPPSQVTEVLLRLRVAWMVFFVSTVSGSARGFSIDSTNKWVENDGSTWIYIILYNIYIYIILNKTSKRNGWKLLFHYFQMYLSKDKQMKNSCSDSNVCLCFEFFMWSPNVCSNLFITFNPYREVFIDSDGLTWFSGA